MIENYSALLAHFVKQGSADFAFLEGHGLSLKTKKGRMLAELIYSSPDVVIEIHFGDREVELHGCASVKHPEYNRWKWVGMHQFARAYDPSYTDVMGLESEEKIDEASRSLSRILKEHFADLETFVRENGTEKR
ncbi:hypothetical protein ACFLS1_08965 [Verrucomicrobiota bacterium]